MHPNQAVLTPTQTRLDTDPARLHVVLVDEELPWPLTSGKRIRTYNLVARLAKRHRLTYVCHRNTCADEARRAATHFSDIGIRPVIVERAIPPRSGPGFYARLATNLFSPLPYSVTSHTSRELIDTLRHIAWSEPVDLWHVEWTPYAQALRGIPGRRVVMAHNVESVIWRRYQETERNPLKRWYIGRQATKFERFERSALGEANLTIAVSDLDAQRFRDDFGVANTGVVDNGVDTKFFTPDLGVTREPETLLFLGSLEWRPNLDGVAQLLDHVFPAVRKSKPNAKLLLVGRNPPAWLKRAALEHPGVELHADVPDVRPFLRRAGMLVVPLRIGGGSRLKILEALSAATPVVSTRVGAEGLHLTPGRHLSVVEDIDQMADAIVDTIRDPESAMIRTDAGRHQVLQRYDWGVLAERLDELWRQTTGQMTRG